MDFKKDDFKFPGLYRGLVLDNDDPDKLGRIKVKIFTVFSSEIPATYLPWAVPAFPLFTGSGNGFGSFAVPEINSHVFVMFEAQDFNQPVYFAEAPTASLGIPTESATNYPSRRVLKTKNGIVFYIDDSNKEIKVTHPTGAFIQIDSSGNINISSSGDVSVESSGDVDISGATVNINPN